MVTVFINEIHYDNNGTDTGEFVEIAGLAGTDLTGWTLVLYNGNGGTAYSTISLSTFSIDDESNGFGAFSVPTPGIQNGAPDGIALVDNTGTVVQFLSYEGVFTGVGGAANGLTSTNIGVSQSGTGATGLSLQLTGTGAQSGDFIWNAESDDSPGTINAGQIFTSGGGGTTLAIADVSQVEGNAGTKIFTFTVSLNTPAGPGGVTFDIATADNTATTANADYVPKSLIGQTIPAGSSTYTFDVVVNGDTGVESNETFFVNVTNVTGATVLDGQGQGTIQNDDLVITKIHQIQGNATTQLPNISGSGAHDDRSPLEGQTVTIQGIVTAVYPQLNGFFIQEETTDVDADPTTSEGIFVFTGSAPTVSEGNLVTVTGAVDEFFGMTQIDNDNGNISVTINNNGDNLNLVAPAIIDLPAVGDLDDYYEQFEGMKVQFSDKLVVSEYFELARYGQLVLTEGDRPFQYTHIDNTPTAAEYTTFLDSLNRSRIILDDGNNIQNAPLPSGVFPYPQPDGLGTGTQGTNYFRGGDSVTNLTGVLHWSFAGQTGTDAWRIRPTQADPVTFTVENPRPASPPDVDGNIKVASFNVLNYFNTIDTTGGNGSPRGADSTDEFDRQNEKLIQALIGLNADVVGLMEIENNGSAGTSAVEELVNRLNTQLGTTTYDFINTGDVGTDQITVAFIYKSTVVEAKGAAAILTDDEFTDPNGTGQQRSRPAIAQTFRVIDANNEDFGESFNVVVNHLKSKGASDATGADFDQLDGQGAWNDTRTKAASYLVNTWIPSDPTGQGDPDFLIIGDLNAYKGETPITAIKNAGYTDLVESFGGNNAYGYVFNGQLGYLDHALANASLASQVTGVAEWHINADEVPVFDYNNNIDDGAGEQSFEAKPTGNNLYEANAFRTSDHDPVIVGLNLATPNQAPTAVALTNPTTTITENTSTATRIKVAEVSITDDALGTNTLSVTGADAASFEVDATGLYLKAGTILDFEAKPSYSVTVEVDDTSVGSTPDAFTNFILTLTDVNEANEIIGDESRDFLNGTSGDDVIRGLGGNDLLFGNRGDDKLYGGQADDYLDGGAGNDTLYGGEGNDLLLGGDGNDVLVGGPGADRLSGGRGEDKFVYNALNEAGDTIFDFNPRQDQLVLTVLTDLLTNLSYSGENPIADGYLRFNRLGFSTRVQIDADGSLNGSNYTTLTTLIGVFPSSLSLGGNVVI